ncbi:MAG: hypothetical protein P8185_06895 [Deltaproteobacteria bacterium]|jgi:hypothetical protein
MPDPLKKLKDTERKNLEHGSPRFHKPRIDRQAKTECLCLLAIEEMA